MTKQARSALAAVAALAPLLATSSNRAIDAPAALHTFTIHAGTLSLRVVRAGQGTSVVLLHGYGESLFAWREVFQLLARNSDVIALDLPGFGLSSKPATGYTVDSIAAVVVRALDALAVQRPVLIGHSLGGAVAAAVALSHPDRAAALVLVDPAVAPTGWSLAAVRPDSAPMVLRLITEYEKLRARFGGVHDPAWLAEPDTALAYDPAGDPAYHTALQAVLREFDFAYLNPARARHLHLPVLVLWGAYDPIVPLRDGQQLAAALPDARLEVIPRSWHRPHEERPADVAARIIAFLARLGGSNSRFAP